MRILSIIVAVIIIGAVAYQVISFLVKEKRISGKFYEIQAELDKVTSEQEKLRAELKYLSNPDNLEKELRARFNLRSPDEKTLIIVPDGPVFNQSTSENNNP